MSRVDAPRKRVSGARKTALGLGLVVMSLLVLPVLLRPLLAQNGSGFGLTWWTVDGGGGHSTSAGQSLDGTIGQPDAGTLSGGGYALQGGFMSAFGAVAPSPTATSGPTPAPGTRTPTPRVSPTSASATPTSPLARTPTPTNTPVPGTQSHVYMPVLLRGWQFGAGR